MPTAEPIAPVTVFCDGASSGNPGPGGWGAIVATADGRVAELGGYEPGTTNNRMELMATIRALQWIEEHAPGLMLARIHTDSTYVIKGITQWIWAWRRSGWKTKEGGDVINQDLWKTLSALVARRKVDWRYVRGHTGVPGNERCDAIAVAYSKGQRPTLYKGPLLRYGVPIHDLPEGNGELPEPRARVEKAKAYSYLSLIGGTAMRHATWPECERRVKGQSAAKFKKAMSPEDEEKILRDWGVPPGNVKNG
jgi:ribonuclease HI